jgi:hypothetical protein
MQYLAITDADAIHSYVFAPHELRLIRGGSSLLDACNDQAAALVSAGMSGCKIFDGGGQVLAKFPTGAQAEEFCRKVRDLYREKTQVATVSTAIAEYPSPERFQESLDDLLFKLERAKQRRTAGYFNGGSPYFASCQSCGLYPASGASVAPEHKIICRPCCLREEQTRKLRQAAENEPQSFEDIARQSHPQNYMALIYLDFDRLGRYLKAVIEGKESRYTVFSTRVKDSIKHAVTEAGKQAPGSITLVRGGDDAVVVMAAQHALKFLQVFREAMDEFWNREEAKGGDHHAGRPRPSFSAGMVLAHSHFPIAEFMRIAEDLLRSAKRLQEQDAIDYEVVTNSMIGKVLEQRKRFGRRRTSKPYRWADFQDLAGELVQLKKTGAPASKVKALYHIAYQSDLQAELEYLHLLSRLDSRSREIMRRPQAVGLGLWQASDTGAVATRAADLAELWEFV